MTWKKWKYTVGVHFLPYNTCPQRKKSRVSDGQAFIFCKGYSALWWHSQNNLF